MPYAVPRPRPAAGYSITAPGVFSSGQMATVQGQWVGARNTVVGFQWYRGAASVSGATSASYLITSSDSGLQLVAYQSQTNQYGMGVAAARRSITLA